MAISDLNNAKNVLHEIATQAYSLAMGLQNAAPSQEKSPPKSVQYLIETSLVIEKISKNIEEMILAEASQKKRD